MLITGEGIEIATRFRAMGVRSRSPRSVSNGGIRRRPWPALFMKVRSEAVQIRVLAEEIGVRPRRRSLPYVEQPGADFFSQSAEMCRRSRTFMNNAG